MKYIRQVKETWNHTAFYQVTNITLEPGCEADSVQRSPREIISAVHNFDKLGSVASVKVELPVGYVNSLGDYIIMHKCSQNCLSVREQSQLEKKLVRQEQSDVLCNHNSLSKMVSLVSCYHTQELAGHNT